MINVKHYGEKNQTQFVHIVHMIMAAIINVRALTKVHEETYTNVHKRTQVVFLNNCLCEKHETFDNILGRIFIMF